MRVIADYMAKLLNQLSPTFKAAKFTSDGRSTDVGGRIYVNLYIYNHFWHYVTFYFSSVKHWPHESEHLGGRVVTISCTRVHGRAP